MGGAHDMGGSPGGPIDKDQHEVEDWGVWPTLSTLRSAGRAPDPADGNPGHERPRRIPGSLILRTLGKLYEQKLLIEKGLLSSDEIDERTAEISHRWNRP